MDDSDYEKCIDKLERRIDAALDKRDALLGLISRVLSEGCAVNLGANQQDYWAFPRPLYDELRLGGMGLVVDETCPPDEIQVRDTKSGEVVARMLMKSNRLCMCGHLEEFHTPQCQDKFPLQDKCSCTGFLFPPIGDDL